MVIINEMLLDISIILILLVIVVQDWKDRAVYWFIFPILAALAILRAYLLLALDETLLTDWFISFSFLSFNTIILLLYISIKNKRFVNITAYIGLGDLLFFITLIFFGTFMHFILFYTCSLAASLVIWLCVKKYAKEEHVPLAGLQALCLVIVWTFISLTQYNTFQDERLLAFLFN